MGQESNKGRDPGKLANRQPIPLTGEALDAAVACMERQGFFEHITVRIMKIAEGWGFHSPDDEDTDLPGGKSAADLAVEIAEKGVSGVYTWNREDYPDFEDFCVSRAKSILSNWLKLNKKLILVSKSPVSHKEDESGELTSSFFNTLPDPNRIENVLMNADAKQLADDFMQEFALSLDENSVEQRIAIAIVDNRQCLVRATCIQTLGVDPDDYDAGMKRLKRRYPAFKKSWSATNKTKLEDWKGIQ